MTAPKTELSYYSAFWKHCKARAQWTFPCRSSTAQSLWISETLHIELKELFFNGIQSKITVDNLLLHPKANLILISVVFLDVDECVNNAGMKKNVCTNGECQNTMKDYICVCNAGFRSDVTKKLCNGIQGSFIRHTLGRLDGQTMTDRQTHMCRPIG